MEAAAVRIDGVLAQMGTEEGLTDDSLKAALDQALAEHARAREALVALLRTPEEKMRDELLS
jgi:hypothetical protein